MKRNLDIDRARRELALVRQSNGDYIPSAAIRDWTTNLPALLDELEAARAVVRTAEATIRHYSHSERNLPSDDTMMQLALSDSIDRYRQTIGKGGAS